MKATLQTFTNSNQYWNHIREQVLALQTTTSDFDIAASGGSAANFFDHFLPEEIHMWNVWQVDERYVPADHDDSNIKLLSGKIKNIVHNFYSFDPSLEITDCVATYEDQLQVQKKEKEHIFDCVVLGVGPDGHTASLFPQSPLLEEEERLTGASQTEVFAVKDRLSVTWPVIENAKKVIVLMMGSGKKEILDMIIDPETNWKDFPARRLMDLENVEVCFLDV